MSEQTLWSGNHYRLTLTGASATEGVLNIEHQRRRWHKRIWEKVMWVDIKEPQQLLNYGADIMADVQRLEHQHASGWVLQRTERGYCPSHISSPYNAVYATFGGRYNGAFGNFLAELHEAAWASTTDQSLVNIAQQLSLGTLSTADNQPEEARPLPFG